MKEWIKILWVIHIQENITQPLKKNDIVPFMTLMGLKDITLNEMSDKER